MSAPISVPLLDLRAQYASIREELDEAVRRVVESQQFIMGPDVAALEAETAQYCGTRHAIGCGSGSDALLLALIALDVGPGDEVICPSYTFFATAGAIARIGARPVFVEIDRATYNVDPGAVREAAARCQRLKAIIPVHLFGQSADLDALLAIGDELDVPVIEDAAQAIGARDSRGQPVGSRGRVGCYSFFPSKNLGGFGDGGIVTTNDDALAERMSILRVHGMKPKYYHQYVGFNSRLDTLQAAVVRVKLRHLDGWSRARGENAAHYDHALSAAGAVASGSPLRPGGLPLWTPRPVRTPASHIYNQYVIRVPAALRDPLRKSLADSGIGTEIYYPLGLHQQECFADLGYGEADLPETESAARETIALPVYPELTRAQLDHVVASLTGFLREAAGQS
jgi:dTDP-4-amino-4,6-dideoxygalactose transaminase